VDDQKLQSLRDLINEELLAVYTTGPESLTRPIYYVLSGSGKRLRPILTLITAKTCGCSTVDSLPAALAVEVLHNFTLVHDDIMDDDHTRHGQLTVHEKWDVGTAILTGDAMLSLAMILLLHKDGYPPALMPVFTEGLLKVCEGQALDKEFENRNDVTIDEYVEMIDLKTGHLLGLSAEMGAIVAGVSTDVRQALRDYARLIGRAFQVQDDLLEIYSDSSKMGKSLHSDIILGKKTYLMIQALTEIPERITAALHTAEKDIATGLQLIRQSLDEQGIHEQALEYVESTIQHANDILAAVDVPSSDLMYFSNLITKRRN